MKVLLDANLSRVFEEELAYRLEASGWTVGHAYDEDLHAIDNGALMQAALDAGYTHLATFDKRMAKMHVALLPILLMDQPANVESEHTYATVLALANRLKGGDLVVGYHEVEVPGYEMSQALADVRAKRHPMHPDNIARQEANAARRSKVVCG